MFKFNTSNAAYTISLYCLLVLLFSNTTLLAQNSMVGDGFGGRLWYKPTNYSVGSYSAFTVCEQNGSNQLLGWGSNHYGELGQIPSSGSISPLKIPNMNQVKFYSTGYLSGAIKEDNSGWVWGYTFGQFEYQPTQVISNVQFVDAGASLISFVKNDGTVWSLGSNFGGSFGNGTLTNSYSLPVQMTGISDAKRVACGEGVIYALLNDRTVVGAGYGNFLGLSPPISESHFPIKIPNLENIVDIKASTIGLLALNENGDVFEIGGTHGYDTATKLIEYSNIVAISGMCDGLEYLLLDENKIVIHHQVETL